MQKSTPRHSHIDWAAYLYVAPAVGLAVLFSFFSMGVSFWTSLHDWDPFLGGGRCRERAPGVGVGSSTSHNDCGSSIGR